MNIPNTKLPTIVENTTSQHTTHLHLTFEKLNQPRNRENQDSRGDLC